MDRPFLQHRAAPYFILFLLSLAIRLVYLWEISGSPFFDHAVVDEYIYDHMAKAIVRGLPEQNGVFRPPLYPMFLALWYAIIGPDVGMMRVIQMFIGAATTVMLYHFTKSAVDRRTALVAGLLHALYWPAVLFQAELLAISIFSIILLFTVHFFHRGTTTGGSRFFLVSGLFLGCAALVRGTALLVLPALLIHGTGMTGGRRAFRSLAVFCVAAGVVISLSGLRNYARTGHFILLSSNGAVNFYTGNGPEADGLTPVPPGVEWNRMIREPIRLGLTSPSAQSRYWLEKTLGHITGDPARFIVLYLKKCYAFWNAFEVSNNKDIYYMRNLSKLLSLPLPGFGLVGALALLSLFVWRRLGRETRLAWMIVVFYMLGTALFFAAARYRMAVIPFFIILAAWSVTDLFDDLSRKRPGSLAGKSALLILCLLFVNLDPLDIRASVRTRPTFQIGQILLTEGRIEEALAHMEEALERDPDDPDILNNLGVAYRRRGEPERALDFYERALREGEFSGVRWNLGLLYFDLEHYEEAERQWEKALEGDPLNPAIRSNLAKVKRLLAGDR